MKLASNIGGCSNTFSHLFDDELHMMLAKNKYPNIFDGTAYFVRSEDVSLKCGMFGIGPYYDFEHVIKSLVSEKHYHSSICDTTTKIVLYLIPWTHINKDKEFRIFVYNKKITAISQQYLYEPNNTLLQNPTLLHSWLPKICDYVNNVVIPKVDHLSHYVLDIALIDNDEVYFIEINPFGKEYSAGSALFHWIIDEDILYDKTNNIVVRYTIQ